MLLDLIEHKYSINNQVWFLFSLGWIPKKYFCLAQSKDPGGSMSFVVGLPNNSNKPITNTVWVCARLCKLQKRVHSTDKVYQLFAHGRWFSPGTLASSTSKTGRHDIAEILLKVALNTKNHHHRHGSVQQHISFFQSNFNSVFFPRNSLWNSYFQTDST